ncbi:hypothetical protein ACFPFV_08205 [Salinicoccus siamensis]
MMFRDVAKRSKLSSISSGRGGSSGTRISFPTGSSMPRSIRYW